MQTTLGLLPSQGLVLEISLGQSNILVKNESIK